MSLFCKQVFRKEMLRVCKEYLESELCSSQSKAITLGSLMCWCGINQIFSIQDRYNKKQKNNIAFINSLLLTVY